METHRAWKFGNNIDTDAILPGRFMANWNKHPEKLKDHCFADLYPEFAKEVRPGDIIVAGANFGCGSSRESAPVAIKMTGVSVVIAQSFARIFFRNSINIGLLALESPEASKKIHHGDCIQVTLEEGAIHNLTNQEMYPFTPLPPFLREILDLGGLTPYVQRRLGIE
jgi:3-isopropylmalate/(R)-2-methylmalate dehydratase small subunit